MEYQIEVLNRNYTEWKTNPEILFENPLSHKLFHNDVFSLEEEKDKEKNNKIQIQIIDSPTRNSKIIPGILISVQFSKYVSPVTLL